MKSISITERRQAGKNLRKTVSRGSHGSWTVGSVRRDPVEIIGNCSQGRLPKLLPTRYGRMLRSPFTFLRGSAGLMAYDLACTPNTGMHVQACGDCHLLNFGLFATPERNLIFDVRDFDETLRAPWEWDLKRLATSFVLVGRLSGIADRRLRDVVASCAQSYRTHMREFSEMSPLEVWYYRLSAEDLIKIAPNAASRRKRESFADRARLRIGEHLFPKITEEVDGRHRFVEEPPLIVRMSGDTWRDRVRNGIEDYRATLPEDRRFVFDRYWLEDFALRVVGIGSVARRCYVALFFCDDKNPLLLQVKEARQSVLEPYVAKSLFLNQGQRVVIGQRLMQSASDIFLGWLRGQGGRDFYVRQLRDMKLVIPVEGLTSDQLEQYADACGWTLARAHARSGDSAMISGYLGGGDKFESALGNFSIAYADQTEQDYSALIEAARVGRVATLVEEGP